MAFHEIYRWIVTSGVYNINTSGIIVTVVLLVIAKNLHQLYLWPHFLSPLRHAPGPPLKDHIYGEMPNIIRVEAGVLQKEWAKAYGPTVRAVGPFGLERMMFLSPDAMQKVLSSDWTDYPRPDFLRNILGVTAGYGLLTVTGEDHRLMRKAINPAFSISSLMAQTDMYYGSIYSLVKILKLEIANSPTAADGRVFHMYDWMSKVTLDIICLTAFGYETDSLHNPDNELADAYHDLISLQSGKNLALFILIMSIPGFLPILKSDWMYKRRHWFRKWSALAPTEVLLSSMRRIKSVSSQILRLRTAETMASVQAGDNTLKRDVMSILIQSRLGEGGGGYKMDDNMMMEQVLTFLGAGHETTASGLVWTLWLLAINPTVQSKLRAEVSNFVADNPTPDFRTLKQMEYLEDVVMESLRLYPPVPMTIRKAGKSDYIDGIWVPKGTLMYIAIRVVNTFKDYWGDDAEEFRPERWSELPKTNHPNLSFLTFIAGPHHCIGKTMAVVEMKAVLAILITNFSFEPAYVGQRAKPTAAVTMKPADGLPLRVRAI